MATTNKITGDLEVTGTITIGTGLDRLNLKIETFGHQVPLTDFRIWDAMSTNLTAAGSDDLGLTTGTFGTAFPYITSGDLNAAGAITRRARVLIGVPDNYVPGQNFFFTVEAGMLTAVASVSATVDVELYSYNGSTLVNGIAGDRVTTAAQSINSLTFGAYQFTVNGASVALEPGELLDARVTIAANSATASSHFAVIGSVYLELPIRG